MEKKKLHIGDLLLASDDLDGTEFSNALILLVAHSLEDGTVGLVLNHVVELPLCEVFSPVPETTRPSGRFYLGGPVDEDTLFMVLLGELGKERQAQLVKGQVYMGGEWESLEELLMMPEEQVMLFLGYAGWDPGQLEEELAENTWHHYTPLSVDEVLQFVRQGNACERAELIAYLEQC